MPPRKSDATKVAATGDESTPLKEGKEGVNIEDLNLPRSVTARLAKGVLPPNTQIQSNAMIALSKSATVFVNYLASHANDIAQAHNRKTIMPGDVFKTLEELQFAEFRPRLEAELQKFSDLQTDKRNNYRKKVAADRAVAANDGDGDVGSALAVGEDGQPAAKKARRNTSGNESVGMSDVPDDDMMTGGDGEGEEEEEEEEEEDDEEAEEGEDGDGAEAVEGDLDGDETEDDENENENGEVEERAIEVEDRDVTEGDDEALDNGGDSD